MARRRSLIIMPARRRCAVRSARLRGPCAKPACGPAFATNFPTATARASRKRVWRRTSASFASCQQQNRLARESALWSARVVHDFKTTRWKRLRRWATSLRRVSHPRRRSAERSGLGAAALRQAGRRAVEQVRHPWPAIHRRPLCPREPAGNGFAGGDADCGGPQSAIKYEQRRWHGERHSNWRSAACWLASARMR